MNAPLDSIGTVERSLKPGSRVRAEGLKGASRGYVLARLARKLGSRLVCVTADDESAEHLASDLAFFLGEGTPDSPTVLHLPCEQVLPYEELSPDAATVTERLSTLYHLRQG